MFKVHTRGKTNTFVLQYSLMLLIKVYTNYNFKVLTFPYCFYKFVFFNWFVIVFSHMTICTLLPSELNQQANEPFWPYQLMHSQQNEGKIFSCQCLPLLAFLLPLSLEALRYGFVVVINKPVKSPRMSFFKSIQHFKTSIGQIVLS